MKVPKTFVLEKNLEKKTKGYLNKVEYVQKPYDEEELGIGATVTLPEMFLDAKCKDLEEEFKKKLLVYTVTVNPVKDYGPALGIGAADTPPEYMGLSEEELEKKILEDYTTLP